MTYYRHVGNPHDGIRSSFTLAPTEAVDPATGEAFAALYTWDGTGDLHGYELWEGPHTLGPQEAE